MNSRTNRKQIQSVNKKVRENTKENKSLLRGLDIKGLMEEGSKFAWRDSESDDCFGGSSNPTK
jgi:hypothetical protein